MVGVEKVAATRVSEAFLERPYSEWQELRGQGFFGGKTGHSFSIFDKKVPEMVHSSLILIYGLCQVSFCDHGALAT